MVATMIEEKLLERIEQERGREPRSSFIRHILVDWYNSISQDRIDD